MEYPLQRKLKNAILRREYFHYPYSETKDVKWFWLLLLIRYTRFCLQLSYYEV